MSDSHYFADENAIEALPRTAVGEQPQLMPIWILSDHQFDPITQHLDQNAEILEQHADAELGLPAIMLSTADDVMNAFNGQFGQIDRITDELILRNPENNQGVRIEDIAIEDFNEVTPEALATAIEAGEVPGITIDNGTF